MQQINSVTVARTAWSFLDYWYCLQQSISLARTILSIVRLPKSHGKHLSKSSFGFNSTVMLYMYTKIRHCLSRFFFRMYLRGLRFNKLGFIKTLESIMRLAQNRDCILGLKYFYFIQWICSLLTIFQAQEKLTSTRGGISSIIENLSLTSLVTTPLRKLLKFAEHFESL